MTPSSLSKGGSMHQKQPPAKIAVSVIVAASAPADDLLFAVSARAGIEAWVISRLNKSKKDCFIIVP